jgi:hypothetical protein
MTVAVFVRAVAACALIAGSALAFPAAAQSGYNEDNNSGQAPPTTSDRGSAPDPSHGPSGVPKGSDTSTGQSGYNTGQDQAEPGSSTGGGRGGQSNAPNCPTIPPNAAECPQQGK